MMNLTNHLHIIPRMHHLALGGLGPLRPVQMTRLVAGAQVDLRPVVVAEARVPPPLVLAQHVHATQELLVALARAGSHDHHAALHVLALDAAEQQAAVITRLRRVTRLFEHFNVGDFGLEGDLVLADELDFRVFLEGATLDAARGDGAAAGDGEDVLDGHEEGLVDVALGGGDPFVDGGEELVDLLDADVRLLAFDGAEGRAEDDGGFVALEAVGGEQFAHFHLDELEHLFVF